MIIDQGLEPSFFHSALFRASLVFQDHNTHAFSHFAFKVIMCQYFPQLKTLIY